MKTIAVYSKIQPDCLHVIFTRNIVAINNINNVSQITISTNDGVEYEVDWEKSFHFRYFLPYLLCQPKQKPR